MSITKTKNKNSFFQFHLKSKIIKAVKEMGCNHPTPMQEEVIPYLIFSDQNLILWKYLSVTKLKFNNPRLKSKDGLFGALSFKLFMH